MIPTYIEIPQNMQLKMRFGLFETRPNLTGSTLKRCFLYEQKLVRGKIRIYKEASNVQLKLNAHTHIQM